MHEKTGRIYYALKMIEFLIAELQQEQKKTLHMNQVCVICIDNTISHMVTPCNHICLCANCGEKLILCPVCRGPAGNIVKVFCAGAPDEAFPVVHPPAPAPPTPAPGAAPAAAVLASGAFQHVPQQAQEQAILAEELRKKQRELEARERAIRIKEQEHQAREQAQEIAQEQARESQIRERHESHSQAQEHITRVLEGRHRQAEVPHRKATAYTMYCREYIDMHPGVGFPPKGSWARVTQAEVARYQALANVVNTAQRNQNN